MASTLNRVLKQGVPGTPWIDHELEFLEKVNVVTDSARIWTVNSSGLPVNSELFANGALFKLESYAQAFSLHQKLLRNTSLDFQRGLLALALTPKIPFCPIPQSPIPIPQSQFPNELPFQRENKPHQHLK